jgi:hypothetical protein
MEEAPEKGKESSHSAHANGMNGWNDKGKYTTAMPIYILIRDVLTTI